MATIQPSDWPGPSGELLSLPAKMPQGYGDVEWSREVVRVTRVSGARVNAWGSKPPLLQSWASLEKPAGPVAVSFETRIISGSRPGARQEQ